MIVGYDRSRLYPSVFGLYVHLGNVNRKRTGVDTPNGVKVTLTERNSYFSMKSAIFEIQISQKS